MLLVIYLMSHQPVNETVNMCRLSQRDGLHRAVGAGVQEGRSGRWRSRCGRGVEVRVHRARRSGVLQPEVPLVVVAGVVDGVA